MINIFKRSRPSPSPEGQDAVIAALIGQATPGAATALATAAVEQAAGLYGRAFQMASASPTGARTASLAAALPMVARDLIRRGESVCYIRVMRGRVMLYPVSYWDVQGTDPDPQRWMYRCDVPAPDLTRTHYVPAAQVLHFRYAISPVDPWRGRSPMQWASDTGTLSGGLEDALARESGGAYGKVIPLPKPDVEINQSFRGKVLPVESAAAGWVGAPNQAVPAPRQDWGQKHLGIDPPPSVVNLRSMVCEEVLRACGVPPKLDRESFRAFLHSSLQPMAEGIAMEASAKLGVPVTLSFDRLFASDLVGRARAFQSMVGGGMDTTKAAGLAGLMEAES